MATHPYRTIIYYDVNSDALIGATHEEAVGEGALAVYSPPRQVTAVDVAAIVGPALAAAIDQATAKIQEAQAAQAPPSDDAASPEPAAA